MEGFGYNGGVRHADASRPEQNVKANGENHVWYTRRGTGTPPRGAEGKTNVISSPDWDRPEIWYATGKGGFVWEELGVAVPRFSKPQVSWCSVSTPDILVWKGKYYFYYERFMEMSGKRGNDCPVSVWRGRLSRWRLDAD